MGKNDAVDGVLRGSQSATAVAAPTVKNRGSGYVPLWEGYSANSFPAIPWEKRSYGFCLTSGIIVVLQQEWIVNTDKEGNQTAKAVAGTTLVPRDCIEITYKEVVTLFENCRKDDKPARYVFAQHFGHRLSLDHKKILAAAPDVYIAPLPKTGVEAVVEDVDVDAFWKTATGK